MWISNKMNYQCKTCEAVDCKLWRQSHILADFVELICFSCLHDLGHVVKLDESDQVYDPKVNSINYLPAIPDLNGNWWGYTSVPRWWVNWWKSLPDHKDQCLICCGDGNLEELDCCFCKGTGLKFLDNL